MTVSVPCNIYPLTFGRYSKMATRSPDNIQVQFKIPQSLVVPITIVLKILVSLGPISHLAQLEQGCIRVSHGLWQKHEFVFTGNYYHKEQSQATRAREGRHTCPVGTFQGSVQGLVINVVLVTITSQDFMIAYIL